MFLNKNQRGFNEEFFEDLRINPSNHVEKILSFFIRTLSNDDYIVKVKKDNFPRNHDYREIHLAWSYIMKR